MLFRSLRLGLIAAALSGCSASVDAETGQVLTDRVWFDQTGTASCPHPDCAPEVKLQAAAKYWEPAVDSHGNRCSKGHPVTWTTEDVICWSCDGTKTCRTCKGAATGRKDQRCADCLEIVREGGEWTVTRATGLCGVCEGRGLLRHGGLRPVRS